ncbi:phenylethanolamine N-methyltransferase-like [Discoglossus pictus]
MNPIDVIAENYKRFDPKEYLQNNYVAPRADFSREDSVVSWKLRCLADACASGKIGGHTLLDVGSGPTIYQLLSAFELFDEVIMSDFLEVNRNELNSWLQDEPGAFDWTPYIQYVCDLEGKGEPWQDKQKRLREKVKCVTSVDIHQDYPMGVEVDHGAVDCMVSAFCFEACSPDKNAFKRALRKTTGLIKPGGDLLLIGALEESYYMAGEARLNVVPLTETDVRYALECTCHEILDFRTYYMPQSMKVGVDDVNGIFFAWAQKQSCKENECYPKAPKLL